MNYTQKIKKTTALLNEFKKNHSRFIAIELREFCKKNQINYKQRLLTKLKSKDLCYLQDKKYYRWTSEKPIHISLVYIVYEELKKQTTIYYKKYCDKNKHEEEVVVVEGENHIEEAIKLLKSHGYKIMKPIIEFQEIL